ncbi:hypothetical protein [Paenibacillus kandeliae]|uniref:hypothetical protein n=1 Tax=Paenibacillus kandeliae TaxID=3231269 RepID=UPI00345A0AD4
MFRIQHLTLYTAILEPMYDFYVQLFGKDLVQLQAAGFTVQLGTSVLEYQQATAGDQPFYHFALNIAANHLEQAKAWIAATTPLSMEDGQEDTHSEFFHSVSCYFEDPAGNIIECIARQQHAPMDSRPFTTASIRGIGEINLTTSHVLETAHVLQDANVPIQTELIDKDRLNFVGDIDTYLLLGPVGRRWFFSDRLSELHPLTIHMQDGLQLTMSSKGQLAYTAPPA